ncbi:MAG: ABC transporter substrate-binding protein [Corynebacterium sp.]|nr:ABC transporter substrate-binding protein [Corynebacterium sp.]MDN5719076.1 ABC transporter substrate-binding protein [Corynebacterium sp.]MDN6323859.1 ABC transporter substrate-binding protein [Corynebacterium sp.]
MTDGLGRTVELDKPASRVAVLEWQEIEDAISLCVDPVAVASPDDYGTYVSAEALPDDVVNAGERGEPDLDAIYGADPDLIIVEAYSEDDAVLTQLEDRDVPVLAVTGADAEDQIGTVKNTLSMIGEATGRSARAEEVNQEFDDHLAAAREELADTVATLEDRDQTDFLYFDGWVESGNLTIRPYTSGALMTQLGEELGMTSAWTDDVNESYGDGGVDPAYGLAQTDIEGLTAVGDANLFYTGSQGGADDYVAAMTSNPIWNNLSAVEEDHTYEFPNDLWAAGGPRSCIQLIDAFVEAVKAVEAASDAE